MIKCKADRGIHQLPGLSPVQVEPLLNRLKADKSREARSLRRECRLWFKRNIKPTVKRDGGKVSEQTGISDKWIVATV
jgi:hypothetical protein